MEHETISSKRIYGLSVTGLFENAEIKLPITYVRPMIPAHESQIPRKKTAMKYDHLKQIAKNLSPEGQKIRIGLNCIKAVKPIEVIP
ncbi:hypothetical protein SNE40_004172 [Patella caerulea]|uniref:Uncharacterized protein n=1 Tax=Patella caerulea TaxID=87958 RepID=A0AAN8K9F2_PATCE